MLKGIVWLCVSNFARSQQPQHAPPSQGPCRDASEPGVQESRESHRHHLPTVARHVPVDEHQVHGGDWLPLWLGLRTSPFGKSLTGGPWVLLSDFTPGKVAAAYLMGGGVGHWTAESTHLGPAYKIIFSKHTAPPSPLSGLQVAKPCCWAMLFYLQGLHRGQYEVISLDPLPSVSANIPRGLQLRYCFSSWADVCFNLIKPFTGLNVWTKASVGPSAGGGGRGEGRARGHQALDVEASSLGARGPAGWKEGAGLAKLGCKRSSLCPTSFPGPSCHRAPTGGPHSRAGLSSRETLWAQKLSKGDITGEVGLQRFHREGVVQEFLSSV